MDEEGVRSEIAVFKIHYLSLQSCSPALLNVSGKAGTDEIRVGGANSQQQLYNLHVRLLLLLWDDWGAGDDEYIVQKAEHTYNSSHRRQREQMAIQQPTLDIWMVVKVRRAVTRMFHHPVSLQLQHGP